MKKGGREKKNLSVLQDDLQKYLNLFAGKGEANGNEDDDEEDGKDVHLKQMNLCNG
jgi:hypothetical protein